MYVHYKVWKLNGWIYEQFYNFGDKHFGAIGNMRNVEELFALLKRFIDSSLFSSRLTGRLVRMFRRRIKIKPRIQDLIPGAMSKSMRVLGSSVRNVLQTVRGVSD